MIFQSSTDRLISTLVLRFNGSFGNIHNIKYHASINNGAYDPGTTLNCYLNRKAMNPV